MAVNDLKRTQVWSAAPDNHRTGAYHMIRNDAFEPQRTNNFELQILGLEQLTPYVDKVAGKGSANTNIGTYNEPNDRMSRMALSVKTFDPPNFTVDALTVAYGNNKVKYAGTPNFGSSSLTVNDFIGVGTIEILSAWQRAVYDVETETIGLSSEYKLTAYLYEYAPNGDLHRSWQLAGLWPSSVTYGQFSQDGGMREVSATLEYDYCMPSETSAENATLKSNWVKKEYTKNQY